MTPAIKLLQKQKTSFVVHEYQHDSKTSSYGLEASEKLGIEAHKVFKTLVVNTGAELAVAIIAVDKKLDLKAVAKAIGCKKVAMADPQVVERTTGYVLGGVSPLGQKKRLTTLLDTSAQTLKTVFVSAGKRGLEIELSPQDLLLQTKAVLTSITV